MEKEYKKMSDKPKDAADKVKDAIEDVVDTAKSGNPDPPLKALKDAYDCFVNVRAAHRNWSQKVDDLIKKARQEAARAPGDKKKAQDVEAAGAQGLSGLKTCMSSLNMIWMWGGLHLYLQMTYHW